MTIQLLFDFAPYVSSGFNFEDLIVIFWGGPIFVSKDTGKYITTGTTLEEPLLRQIKYDTSAKVIQQGSFVFALALAALFLLVAFLLFCLSGKLMYVWSFINTMQILVHTPLMAVQMPGNLALFLKVPLNIFRFNWLPIESILD